MKPSLRLFVSLSILLLAGCYRFTGIAIDQDVNTYYVDPFDNRAASVVPTLAPDFTEKLKNKIRNESRLIFTDVDPDIEFSGSITEYRVTSEAPQPDEQVAFNRLTIAIAVTMTNNKRQEEEPKKINKTWYAEFPSDQNLLDVQEELIRTITDQLAEDVFTEAFTSW
ncbi:MAG: hypothetical protein KDC43_09165 [Saprospiraceae bacterium]|nr:hypothetical protein [Saprospiraceae bacterium]MCB0624061.1 hypothetical protein [Saprospiraceae bacterium]MCB0677088.1 hypothetical protein [Saprospiraceae bacterium]MCB0681762.1 hypothetical protein [Saprospiraceae bacterium]